jgi:hypothetical protein
MTGMPGPTLSDCPKYVLAPTPPATASDVNTHQMVTTPTALPPMTARIFCFSPSSLSSLKVAASAHSTNDSLHAALRHHITLARNPRQNAHVNTTHSATSPYTTAPLYAVNVRAPLQPSPPTHLPRWCFHGRHHIAPPHLDAHLSAQSRSRCSHDQGLRQRLQYP